MDSTPSNPTLELTRALVARPSLTPDDAGCQALLAERLAPLGFEMEFMRFGAVDNLWARRGRAAPLLVFAGHTDVVPTGPLEQWHSDPFVPTIRDGRLYGRGVADMKGGVAAMVTAVEAFVAERPRHQGSIAFLLTSDEEGQARDGTRRVVETLVERGEDLDYCLLGEPSSQQRLGDVVKNGRRGSLSGDLRILGKQGHIAYPHLADNPLHRFAPALQELCELEWDQGNAYFPPTSFQIANLRMGTGADNVIPGDLYCQFNFRFCTEQTAEGLQYKVESLLRRHGLRYELNWRLSGLPFITPEGTLTEAVSAAVAEVCGYRPVLSTGGGTSDGRFIAPTGTQVVELGVDNSSIHQIDEAVPLEQLEQLSAIYLALLRRLLPA